MSYNLKMSVPIPDNIFSDILIAAYDSDYGSSNHWSDSELIDVERVNGETVWKRLRIQDTEDNSPSQDGTPPTQYIVDYNIVAIGMQRILDDPSTSKNWHDWIGHGVFNADAGMIDAPLADAIIQMGLFGSVLY